MTTLKEQGFFMPGEWHPHTRCWMAWPSNEPGYCGHFAEARRATARVTRTIAEFEPVTLLANEADAAEAQALCGQPIAVEAVPIDDGWFRDNGPSFVVNTGGELAGVTWDFNGWGRKAGIPFERDRAVSRLILEREGIDCVDAPIVLEGGSFHVDGEGTLMTTEQCLLNPNRNPQLSRREIEVCLENFLGVDRVIG